VSELLSRFLGADVAVSAADTKLKGALGLAQTDQIGPLMGNDLVLARTREGALASWVVKDEPDLRAVLAGQLERHRLARRATANGYQRYAGTRFDVAVKGPLVIVGEPSALDAALTTQQRHSGMTRRLFDARLRGLPADALVRIEADGKRIAPAQQSKIAWLHALNAIAITVRADDSGLHARLRAATDSTATEDLPLAPGTTPPAPLARTNGATAGVRDPGQVLRALHLRVPAAVTRELSGTATIWTPDLKTFTVTIPVADPARVTRALRRLDLAAAGLPGARIGAAGSTVVVTTDPATPFARLAAGRPQRIDHLSGALTGVIRGHALGQALIDRLGLPAIASLALSTLGDTTFAVRTATTGVEASADLTIRK
jgi:hypothetical protein